MCSEQTGHGVGVEGQMLVCSEPPRWCVGPCFYGVQYLKKQNKNILRTREHRVK